MVKHNMKRERCQAVRASPGSTGTPGKKLIFSSINFPSVVWSRYGLPIRVFQRICMNVEWLKLRARPLLVLSAGFTLVCSVVPASWAQDSVKIGLVGPLTGAFASMGTEPI